MASESTHAHRQHGFLHEEGLPPSIIQEILSAFRLALLFSFSLVIEISLFATQRFEKCVVFPVTCLWNTMPCQEEDTRWSIVSNLRNATLGALREIIRFTLSVSGTPRRSIEIVSHLIHRLLHDFADQETVANPTCAIVVFGALSVEGEAAVRNYSFRVRVRRSSHQGLLSRLRIFWKHPSENGKQDSFVEPTGYTVFACDSNLRLLQERYKRYPNVKCLLHQWSNRSDTERCKELIMASFKSVFAVIVVVPEDQRVRIGDVDSNQVHYESPSRPSSLSPSLDSRRVAQRFDEAFANPLISRDGSRVLSPNESGSQSPTNGARTQAANTSHSLNSSASTQVNAHAMTSAMNELEQSLCGLHTYCSEEMFKYSVMPRALQPLRIAKSFVPLLVACERMLRTGTDIDHTSCESEIEGGKQTPTVYGKPRMLLITSAAHEETRGAPFGRDLDINLMKASLQQLQRAPFAKYISLAHIHCEKHIVFREEPHVTFDQGVLLSSFSLNRIFRHRNTDDAFSELLSSYCCSSPQGSSFGRNTSMSISLLQEVSDEGEVLSIRDLSPIDLLVSEKRQGDAKSVEKR